MPLLIFIIYIMQVEECGFITTNIHPMNMGIFLDNLYILSLTTLKSHYIPLTPFFECCPAILLLHSLSLILIPYIIKSLLAFSSQLPPIPVITLQYLLPLPLEFRKVTFAILFLFSTFRGNL